jgi:hypothetical protein
MTTGLLVIVGPVRKSKGSILPTSLAKKSFAGIYP